MKINSIYIASFGGLKNFKLDFTDKFNIILGQNENGKSTVMAFVKMMFYGNEKGGSSLFKNLRKRYTPWDSSAMAGSIDFSVKGRNYRLEREFRSSNSTDKLTLFDLDLGESKTVSGDIGNKIFGLTSAAFERSVFIGQFGFPENDKDAEGELSGKLSNLAVSGEENISFEAVNARLQKAKLGLMSKSGKVGEYDKNLKLLEDLKEQLRNLSTAKAEYNEKKSELENLQAEMVLCAKEAEEINDRLTAEEDLRNYRKFEKLLSLKQELDNLSKELVLSDGTIVDEMYLNKIKFCISKIEKTQIELRSKENEIEGLKKQINMGANIPNNATEEAREQLKEELKNLEAESEESKAELANVQKKITLLEENKKTAQNSKKAVNLKILIPAVLCIPISVVLFRSNFMLLLGGILVSAVLLLLSLVLRPQNTELVHKISLEIEDEKRKSDQIQREESLKSLRIIEIRAKYEAISIALDTSANVIQNQEEMLKTALSKYQELEELEKTQASELFELFSKYKKVSSVEEIREFIPEIAKKTEKIKLVKTELGFYLNELGGISYDTAREKLESLKGVNLDTNLNFEYIKKQKDDLMNEISDKKSKIATLSLCIRQLESTLQNEVALQKKFAELENKITEQKEYCDVLDLASVTLAESFAEVHSSYGLVLEKKAGEILGKLTNGKYGSMTISKSFDISVCQEQVFGTRDSAFLSSGAYDQTYLSLRLALAELICENGETLPILLDDSLAQYDDDRMKTAVEFLNEYAKNHQVIMFTCHNSIAKFAKTQGADYKELVRR